MVGPTEAVRQHVIEQANLEIIEIPVEYLSKYFHARQMALLVEHLRRLQLYNPRQEIMEVKVDFAISRGRRGCSVRKFPFLEFFPTWSGLHKGPKADSDRRETSKMH